MNATNPKSDQLAGTGIPPWRSWFLVERGLAAALAVLLLSSAFTHMGNPYLFLSTVYSYELTSPETGKWLVILLPSWQMAAAVCLLARWWIRATYLLLILTFGLFVTAQALVLWRGIAISCGCFGSSHGLMVGRRTVALAAACAGAAVLGCLLAWSRDRLGRTPTSAEVLP